MEREITTKHLQGISDLTLVAPIRQGLINALDTRTFASRLRAVLRTLHTLRQTSREHSLVRPFSDSTDRIRTITDLRMVILEDEQKLLLSVSFDRPWEPYLRIIWRDVGTLLDVIFCNCEKYPISFSSSFAVYGKWIRDARTNTQFFYKPSALTFDDAQYLRQMERLQRETSASELELAKLVVADLEDIAWKTATAFPPHTVRQGMQALSVLYRLADLYPADTPDAGILLRASQQLLRELTKISAGLPLPVRQRFAAQLAWFEQPAAAAPAPVTPTLRDTSKVQGGILTPHRGVTHGCLLLLSVPNPAVAAGFLATLKGMVSVEGADKPADDIYVNVAFTAGGLHKLGVSDADMEKFPHEFREGMQERAGLIGDVRGNHPRNWALPELRGFPGGGALVQLSTVHIVVHMYIESTDTGHELIDPLRQKVETLMAGQENVHLLSVQAMRRYEVDRDAGTTREHFGFIDEISQPEIGPRPADDKWSNFVGPGELLLGYENDRGDVPEEDKLLDDGSFLVIRKLRQDVAALNKAIAASGIAPDLLKGKMMGRTVDGDPLVPFKSRNEFDYRNPSGSGDEGGGLCPFAAHIRRANPRTKINKLDSRPSVPRIMRRGMSYGPLYKDQPKAERGMMFMAYNASIAEQFEFIQRWVSGGNSTGVLSEHGDPLLGVPQLGETRSFRYYDGASVTRAKRVKLDDAGDNPSLPFVRLEWGIYLFAPSTTALGKLEEIAGASARPSGPDPSVIKQGEEIISRLRQEADWKAALEDPHARSSGESEAVWAAIRANPNGALKTKTPYGVVVASKALVMKVLENVNKEYSVSGYGERLEKWSGEMYLDLDDGGAGSDYRKQSAVTNQAIMAIPEKDAFERALFHAGNLLQLFIDGAKDAATKFGEKTWELTFDVKELSDYTLARLCEEWIGPLAVNKHFQRGGWRWDWKDREPPLYPGHFTAPSRYVFQPLPGEGPEKYGRQHGKAILEAMKLFVNDNAANPPATRLGEPIFKDHELDGGDLRARTLVGVMIGLLPTVDGNLRATLNEWLGGGTLRLTLNEKLDRWSFWDLQNAFVSDPDTDAYAKADKYLKTPLMRTMQLRPVPELGWRTAAKAHDLGGVAIAIGEKIVLGNVSATQEELAADKTDTDNKPDVYPVFGGNRRADPHPTHACPGYDIAMGVLLGMITALIKIGPVRPTPAPLTLSLRGTM